MLKLRVMNSTGAGRTEILSGETTIAEIMEDERFSGLLIGNQFALNGEFISERDFNKSLNALGAKTDGTNFLSSVKAANGAC